MEIDIKKIFGIFFTGLSLFLCPGLTFGLHIKVLSPQGPVPNQKVEIFYFEGGQVSAPEESLTNKNGIATVKRKDLGSEVSLAARAFFSNVMYVSSILLAQHTNEVLVRVYPLSTENKGIEISNLEMSIERREAGLRIDQEIVIRNTRPFTYQSPNGIEIRLPDSSFDLQLGSGFDEESTKLQGNSLLLSKPILPGDSRLQISYSIEKSGSFQLRQAFPFQVSNAHILLMDESLKIQASGLINAPQKFFSGALRETFEWNPNTPQIELNISGIPRNFNWRKLTPFFVLMIGILILLFAPKSQTREASLDPQQEFDKLKRLKRAYDEGSSSELDYQLRRMQSLEKLFRLWKTKDKQLG